MTVQGWLSILLIGVIFTGTLALIMDIQYKWSLIDEEKPMPLYHIDSVTTDASLYVWADSFDNAFSFAVRHPTMESEHMGDIRVRQVMKYAEGEQFKQPVRPLPRHYVCEAVKK